MTPFIGLTRAGAAREVRVNPLAIAYVDLAGGAGAAITFSGGAQLLVEETPEQVERRIDAAEALEGPLPEPAPTEAIEQHVHRGRGAKR